MTRHQVGEVRGVCRRAAAVAAVFAVTLSVALPRMASAEYGWAVETSLGDPRPTANAELTAIPPEVDAAYVRQLQLPANQYYVPGSQSRTVLPAAADAVFGSRCRPGFCN